MGVWTESSGRVTSRVGVDQVPPAILALTTFVAPDYADFFSMDTPRARRFTAEQWARAVLERAPLSRRGARTLWRTMGLRLGPADDAGYVQGWRIAVRDGSHIRLETSAWYLCANAVCVVEGDTVGTFAVTPIRVPAHGLPRVDPDRGPAPGAVPVMLSQADELMAHDTAIG